MLKNLMVCGLMLAVSQSAFAEKKDIVETAVGAGSFKTLAAALGAADLVKTLQGKGPFTVFAPTDEAFAKLPKGTVETLLKPENKDQLIAILTYHVAGGEVTAKDVVKLKGAKTVNGQRINIAVSDKGVKVDNANVVKTDIMCSNGVIHVIDSVILPETKTLPEVAAGAKNFGTLLAAAKAAGLVDALSGKGPLTVFAPTDKAFAKLPKGTVASLLKPENKAQLVEILKYHVVAGRVYSEDVVKLSSAKTLAGKTVSIEVDKGVKVNSSNVIATDIDASNGVIHVIDAVLLPPKTQAEARKMLEDAVVKGSRLYNSGHASECANVYMNAMNTLMNESISGVTSCTHNQMRTTLANAKSEHHAGRRAWILREGIDQMYSQLSSR